MRSYTTHKQTWWLPSRYEKIAVSFMVVSNMGASSQIWVHASTQIFKYGMAYGKYYFMLSYHLMCIGNRPWMKTSSNHLH